MLDLICVKYVVVLNVDLIILACPLCPTCSAIVDRSMADGHSNSRLLGWSERNEQHDEVLGQG